MTMAAPKESVLISEPDLNIAQELGQTLKNSDLLQKLYHEEQKTPYIKDDLGYRHIKSIFNNPSYGLQSLKLSIQVYVEYFGKLQRYYKNSSGAIPTRVNIGMRVAYSTLGKINRLLDNPPILFNEQEKTLVWMTYYSKQAKQATQKETDEHDENKQN